MWGPLFLLFDVPLPPFPRIVRESPARLVRGFDRLSLDFVGAGQKREEDGHAQIRVKRQNVCLFGVSCGLAILCV